MTPAMLDVSRVMQTDATDFTLKNGCGAAIAANASCTMAVAFRPAVAPATVPCGSTAGTKSSTLTIVDNAPTSAQNPATLAFSGVSMDYCLVPAAANSATVTAGGSGAFQIEAESFESFTDTIALTCTATVTQGVCTVQPASLNLAANATTPFQVNITTTAATTSASGGFGKGVARIFVFLPVSGFIWTLVVSAFGLKRRCANALRLAQACVVLVALSVGFAACGGGGSQSAAVAAGTPAGSYPITITGTTSTGATRTVGLMLTVQ